MDWRYNTIWFEQLDKNNFFQQDFKTNSKTEENFLIVEYAILWHLKHKETSFDNLPPSNRLRYLELNWANMKDFKGIDKFGHLKRLELHYCTKLENDLGLSQLSENLQYLHIAQSKKFSFSDELLSLKELRVLCLTTCAPIDNLLFLKNFPNLIDFRFVGTNILDGDLTPIIDHPTIRTVGFLNKRHYNLRDGEVDLALAAKSNKEYQHIAGKDQYVTYRYDY